MSKTQAEHAFQLVRTSNEGFKAHASHHGASGKWVTVERSKRVPTQNKDTQKDEERSQINGCFVVYNV